MPTVNGLTKRIQTFLLVSCLSIFQCLEIVTHQTVIYSAIVHTTKDNLTIVHLLKTNCFFCELLHSLVHSLPWSIAICQTLNSKIVHSNREFEKTKRKFRLLNDSLSDTEFYFASFLFLFFFFSIRWICERLRRRETVWKHLWTKSVASMRISLKRNSVRINWLR